MNAQPSRREFLAASAAALAVAAAAGEPLGWATSSNPSQTSTSTDPFSSVRGVDYYPSWCRSLPDLWTQYDRDAVNFELGLARALGFDSVRVWLGTTPWEQLGNEMWNRVDHFLALSEKLGLKVIPCIFDSCGVEPSTYTGEIVTVREAYARAMKSPKTTADEP